MKKIIICATARCGSTLLCRELEATGVLGKPKEYYIQSKNVDADNANTYWENVLKKGSSTNGVFAIKAMQQQWPMIEAVHSHLAAPPTWLGTQLAKLKRNTKSIQMDHFYTYYKDATWIALKREDKLYQAISREMARQTKVCHIVKPGVTNASLGRALAWEESSNYNQNAVYKPEALLTHIQEIQQEEQAWLAFFKQYKIEPIFVSYETMVNSKQYLQEVAQRAQIELTGTVAEVPVMQVRNELNDEWAERFKQDFPDYQYA
jgi:LPS sulfotransferase NodH